MRGVDVSHWQGVIDWSEVVRDSKNVQFAFCKASQGTRFVDDKFTRNKKYIKRNNLAFGAYHYANGDDSKSEADHFVETVGELETGDILILDYERKDIAKPDDWCLSFLKRVEDQVGFKPILYTYHSILKNTDFSQCVKNDNGLWAARYGLQTQTPLYTFQPTSGSWPFWAIWQYCSRGSVNGIDGNVDLNETKMTMETLLKYGKPKTQCLECCPVHCK